MIKNQLKQIDNFITSNKLNTEYNDYYNALFIDIKLLKTNQIDIIKKFLLSFQIVEQIHQTKKNYLIVLLSSVASDFINEPRAKADILPF